MDTNFAEPTQNPAAFIVPSFARAGVADFGEPDSDEYSVYQELTAISQEIETCRAAKIGQH